MILLDLMGLLKHSIVPKVLTIHHNLCEELNSKSAFHTPPASDTLPPWSPTFERCQLRNTSIGHDYNFTQLDGSSQAQHIIRTLWGLKFKDHASSPRSMSSWAYLYHRFLQVSYTTVPVHTPHMTRPAQSPLLYATSDAQLSSQNAYILSCMHTDILHPAEHTTSFISFKPTHLLSSHSPCFIAM